MENLKKEYPDFYDNVAMNIRFEDGRQGVIDGAVYVQYGYDARVEVLGTEGILFVGQLEDGNTVFSRAGNQIHRNAVHTWRKLFINAYEEEDRAFILSIIEDSTPRVTGHDGLMAVKAVNAGNRSIIEKRPVFMNEDL